jgi:hypothetical protein
VSRVVELADGSLALTLRGSRARVVAVEVPTPLKTDGTLVLVVGEMRTCAARRHGHEGLCRGQDIRTGADLDCETFVTALERELRRRLAQRAHTAITREAMGLDIAPWLGEAAS